MNGTKKCNLRKSFKEKFMDLRKTKFKFVLHQLPMFSVIFFTLSFTFGSSALFFSCGKDKKKKIENPYRLRSSKILMKFHQDLLTFCCCTYYLR